MLAFSDVCRIHSTRWRMAVTSRPWGQLVRPAVLSGDVRKVHWCRISCFYVCCILGLRPQYAQASTLSISVGRNISMCVQFVQRLVFLTDFAV